MPTCALSISSGFNPVPYTTKEKINNNLVQQEFFFLHLSKTVNAYTLLERPLLILVE